MSEHTPKVGARIRVLREQRRLSLRALAEKSGLSINAIGMIERGENSPTVSSLHTLATALDVKIVDFFEDPHEHATVFVKKHQRLSTSGDTVTMESLGYGLRNQQLEPFYVTLKPGEDSGSALSELPHAGGPGAVDVTQLTEEDGGDSLVEHPGQEFVYCLSGVVEYEVRGNRYELENGDSILFDATQPHRFRNTGESTAELIVVFQAAEGTHIARERHITG